MNKLLDKLILFTFCLAFCIQNASNIYVVVPVIITIIVSGFNSYLDNDYLKIASLIAYAIASIFNPAFLFFIPLICYDILLLQWQWLLFIIIIPVSVNMTKLPVITTIVTLLFIALAFLSKRRALHLETIKREYVSLRDRAKEFSMQLENKNKELLDKQDYEINLATLKERNRIAREIHDNVGHLLSSSILQIGALMATCKDDVLKENLNTLKTTLSQGMNSIRNSVHDLHDESVDLYSEVKVLVEGFHFCKISLDYDISGNPDKKIKYTFLSVIKETLSNIIKHTDATHVQLTLREHPALYQLIVKDNGRKKDSNSDNGIGLKNIADRVTSLNGIVNINSEKDFVVFISLPKEKSYAHSNR